MDYYDTQERLIDIFEDTYRTLKTDDYLKEMVNKTIDSTLIYQNDELPSFEPVIKSGQLRVTPYRTLESAQKLLKEYPLKRVAVLNFASPTNPGGGVDNGAVAQEECLCRISSLYPCLIHSKIQKGFYYENRSKRNPFADNKVIYSPDIVVIKEDIMFPTPLRKEDYYMVDVITCAAPNYRHANEEDYKNEYDIHVERAKHIIRSALANHADILVLGAFGCGVFKNHPEVVAKAYKDVLKDFLKYFEVVEFAIYTTPKNTLNYDVFNKTLSNS